jgi:hypothetical protein
MQPCKATKHLCLNNWKHIHVIHVHIDKLCKEKYVSRWEYVPATKMLSYSTKDSMLSPLLAKVEKKFGLELLGPHSIFLAISLSPMNPF